MKCQKDEDAQEEMNIIEKDDEEYKLGEVNFMNRKKQRKEKRE